MASAALICCCDLLQRLLNGRIRRLLHAPEHSSQVERRSAIPEQHYDAQQHAQSAYATNTSYSTLKARPGHTDAISCLPPATSCLPITRGTPACAKPYIASRVLLFGSWRAPTSGSSINFAALLTSTYGVGTPISSHRVSSHRRLTNGCPLG